MIIQYQQLQGFNAQDFSVALNNGLNDLESVLGSLEVYSIYTTVETNTYFAGFWGSYNFQMSGNHFTDNTSVATVTTLSLNNGSTNIQYNGNLTYNFNNDTFGGYFTNIAYSSKYGVISSFNFSGVFNVNYLGEFAGGTASSYSLVANGYKMSLNGTLNLNANEDITSGTIRSFSLADSFGHKLTVSGVSINYTTFDSLTDPLKGNVNFMGLYNFLLQPANLAGNDTIIADDLANSLSGGAGNDNLVSAGGDDTLNGGAGNDTLSGGLGADSMTGGSGNDIYGVNEIGDIVVEGNAGGVDLIKSSISFSLLDTDGIGENGGNVENLTLLGTAIDGIGNARANIITGNANANQLIGNEGNDTLYGGVGNDTLDGGLGNDSLNGGKGDDLYIVNASKDIVIEAFTNTQGGGIDMVQSSVTYILGANVDHLILTGDATINGTGNQLANLIIGNSNQNVLNGSLGADTLKGGAGDDTYVVDHRLDVIDEEANLDTGDTVKYTVNASATLLSTLTIGSLNTDAVRLTATSNASLNLTQIEHLTVIGTGKYNLVGSSADNALTGNAAKNNIEGGAGHDSLIGGLGVDTLNGSDDDDVYIIKTSAEHTAAEFIDSGASTYDMVVFSSKTAGETLTLFAGDTGIENIIIGTVGAGSTNTSGTTALNINAATVGQASLRDGINGLLIRGNDGNNVITGTAFDDNINTGLGSNTVNGGAGNDYLYGDAGKDVLNGGEGNDFIGGGSGNDTLVGGNGNDTLIGGDGNDKLVGGAGADVFQFGSPMLNALSNQDVITDFSSTQDSIYLYRAIFTALVGDVLSSEDFVSGAGAVALDASDYIIYNTSTGALYYDADGNGAGIAIQFATLTSKPTLTAADIHIWG